jgi:hypothetical protein
MNTPSKPDSAIGVFDNLENAERTIAQLRQAGFSSEEIGIIGHVDNQTVAKPPQVNAPEDNAINGFLRGGLGGAIVGVLVLLVIPGLGEVSGMGNVFEWIGGALLGAVAGGLFMALASFVFNRPRARFVATQVEQGNFVVTVNNPARKDEAVNVLKRQGIYASKE